MEDFGKVAAATAALRYVSNNMVIGLGSGSTANIFIEKLAKRVKSEKMKIRCVATSISSKELGTKYGLNVVELDSVDRIDITIDGADEVDDDLNGIKGGGAALFYEKIVAKASDKNIWIVDSSKQSAKLGSFKLPIEVLPIGSAHVYRYLDTELGLHPTYRKNKDESLLTTDSNNFIIDVDISNVSDLYDLSNKLIKHVGIVEHGLFLDICDTLIVGDAPIQIKHRKN